jgi:hypothetical protein
MKPTFLAVLAITLYAAQSILFEQKLAKYSAPAILTIMYVVMLPLMAARLGSMKLFGEAIAFPVGNAMMYALVCGLIYFAADYAFVGAYTSGGSLMLVSTIVTLFPVLAALIKYLFLGSVPNGYQIGGWVAAFIAVVLVTYGESPASH